MTIKKHFFNGFFNDFPLSTATGGLEKRRGGHGRGTGGEGGRRGARGEWKKARLKRGGRTGRGGGGQEAEAGT